ncbi:hypothetical protein CDAR_219231 [Caerostris darwini]|uniref:Ribosomal protein S10 n=1 Tax=Caerostris darwini TaxID=1538125 RepID=A0AAV4R842_9ARAC|nr:hypothetical protein CDAR_219231 [Caerostris darwini]
MKWYDITFEAPLNGMSSLSKHIKWHAIIFEAPSNDAPRHLKHHQRVCHPIRSTIKCYAITLETPSDHIRSIIKRYAIKIRSTMKLYDITFEAPSKGMPSHSKHNQKVCH